MKFPKPQRWKSEKWRDAARDQDCTMRLPGCRNDTSTTVLAHANGAGMGTKADDFNAADMCQHCHDLFDGRSSCGLTKGTLKSVFRRARYLTIANRLLRGIVK